MMKKHLRPVVMVLGATLVITGCNGLGKMNKNVGTITYTVDPNPLIVQGDTVHVNINGNFPAKYFAKKAIAELTPTIVSNGGGETPLKMASYMGEKATPATNVTPTVVPYETGKSFNYSDKTAYKPEMEESQLMLKILGKQGKKEKPFDAVKLADGVITTPYLIMSDDKVIMAKDAFQRVTSHTMNATINYMVASDVVRPGEMKDQDIKDLNAFFKANAKNEKVVVKNVTIDAYASPEGEIHMNDGLANKRDGSAQKYVSSEMGRNKYANAKNDSIYTLNPRGEDWAGFKAAMEASSFKDKDLVLRVLEMYPDVEKRESEIKNMAATYKEIAEDILPALRRSEIKVNYDVVGYSDEELTQMSKTMPDSLNVEELLKAATLTTDMNEQYRIYKECERIHPSDYRASNNAGCILYAQNKMSEAEAQFQKANSTTDNPISTNNLAAITRQKGDRVKAKEMLKKSVSAGPEVNYNLGIIDIQNGNYSSANSNMTGVNSFNSALAKLLGGDAAGAQRTLEQSTDKDTPKGHYLMAICGARQNNGELVRSQLALAAQGDETLRAKAKKDLEFRAFKDNLGL